MIQDISPSIFDNAYATGAIPTATDAIMRFDATALLVKLGAEGDTFDVPTFEELAGVDPSLATDSSRLVYLFKLDDRRFFLDTKPGSELDFATLPDGHVFLDYWHLRRIANPPRGLMLACVTGRHLMRWYGASRFCGHCGTPTVHASDERAMVCPCCGERIYPRINPAVIVGVTHGEELLLTWYAKGRGVSYAALVAGFVEIGETLEQAVAREVFEEVGLRVKNVRYYKSQPWGLASDILSGFWCDVDGDPTVELDESELKRAEWTRWDQIEGQPDNLSLTNEMMMRFRETRGRV